MCGPFLINIVMGSKQSCVLICQCTAEKERRPVAGVKYATMMICGLRTIGGEIGLLTPSKDSTVVVVDTTALKHSRKQML